MPEGINADPEHPLKELAWLGGGLLLLVVLVVAVMSFAAQGLARHIPFAYEQSITADFAADMEDDDGETQAWLQALADDLAAGMDLPEGMSIHVHYVDDDLVNAFATLGGHVVVFRGLLDATPNENALAMVLAHEIAHVRHRDPIVALGRGVLVATALAAVTGVSGNDVASRVLGDAGLMTSLHFSRKQESAADDAALEALARHYGHVAGATLIFEHFLADEKEAGFHIPELFATHPASQRRIDRIHGHARDRGWAEDGETTTLPNFSS